MDNKLLAERLKLQKKLRDVNDALEREKINSILPALKKDYEGGYFKYLNSYGIDSPKWYLYMHVVEVMDAYIPTDAPPIPMCKSWEFQSPEDAFEIKRNTSRCGLSGFVKISAKEFYAAYNKMLKNIDKLPD